MARKQKEKKPKEIVFTEEIDNAINGYAIGIPSRELAFFFCSNRTILQFPLSLI